MAGYFTDKNKKLHNFAGGDNSTKYCLPVGTIFPSAIPLTDASVHLLDGSTISQTGVYQEFAELLKSLVSAGYNISCSQSDFDSAVSSTGNCGKFVINGDSTIRLPKITRFIQGLSNMTNIGDSVEAGLPNITGSFFSYYTPSRMNGDDASGSIYTPQGSGGNYGNISNGSDYGHGFNFDASRSNSIYGNSTTVQPQATSFPYYIVLANGFVSDVKLDVDGIITELNGKLPLTGGTMVDGSRLDLYLTQFRNVDKSTTSNYKYGIYQWDNNLQITRRNSDGSYIDTAIEITPESIALYGSKASPTYNGNNLAFKPTVKFLWTGNTSTTATIENIGNYDFILISGKTTRTGDYWTTALAPTNVILGEISGYEYRIVAFGGTAAANYEFGVKINSATSITTYFTNLTWMQVIGIKF